MPYSQAFGVLEGCEHRRNPNHDNDRMNTMPNNWQALLQLQFRNAEDKTRLVPRKRYGPLSVQRPFYPEGKTCHAYLLHPPGGVVGGDQLDLQVQLDARSSALLTTPGATKFYQSAGGTASVKQTFDAREQTALEFLPQENIYFPGALVNIKTSLDVAVDSHVVLWEKHCFGRPANREAFDHGRIISRLELRVANRLVFTEVQRVDAAEIGRNSGLRNQPVMASMLVYSNRLTTALLEQLRELPLAAGKGGITCPQPDCLIARAIGDSTAVINDWFMALLDVLRPLILHKRPCHPRIWNT